MSARSALRALRLPLALLRARRRRDGGGGCGAALSSFAAARHAQTLPLNAFVAYDAAAAPAGAPRAAPTVSTKANICVEGRATTAGSRALAGYRAATTATAALRAAECGGLLVGSTNMDEFGMGSASAFSHHGAVRNPFSAPWVLRRMRDAGADTVAGAAGTEKGWLVPGGSSGGAAVSVAVGAARFALASDTGGSVRQPAAFCGCVGFKPSYGRIPRWGLVAYASSLDTVGVLARSVADAGRLYAATAGFDSRDDTCIRAPRCDAGGLPDGAAERARFLCADESDSDDVEADRGSLPLTGLRVGLPAEYHVVELDSASVKWWEAGAALLARAGAEVVAVSLPHTADALPAYYVIAAAEAASNLARYDGVRFGHRAAALGASMVGAGPGTATAAALHELYTRTRSEGFGAEVQRRVLAGNFVLSHEGVAGGFYASALRARDRVRGDFARVFRPAPPVAAAAVAASPIARANAAAHCTADAARGVDVLLTPVSPTLPWLVSSAAKVAPLDGYLGDVMTVPASFAHLPAISVPTGYARYPAALLDAALAGEQEESRAALRGQLSRACRLPVGLQLVGRLCDEATLLRVARALERAAAVRCEEHVGPVHIE